MLVSMQGIVLRILDDRRSILCLEEHIVGVLLEGTSKVEVDGCSIN